MTAVPYTVVIPTVGRPSLQTLLTALSAGTGPPPAEVLVVDDRRSSRRPLSRRCDIAPLLSGEGHILDGPGVRVLRSGGRGPAAARNAGWRAASTEWVVFLDDDVVPTPEWPTMVQADLSALGPDVGGCQGRIEVPLPTGRRPTDFERGTAGLSSALWITADMAYRRSVLARVGGFDERFPRAYREDADLALRVQAAGCRLVTGRRTTMHPARTAGFFASVRAQQGNADNALMRRLHGPDWRAAAGESPGRLRLHALTTATALATLTAAAAATAGWMDHRTTRSVRMVRSPRKGAAVAGVVWAALTAEFAVRRIVPGPRTAAEVARMLVTSVLIPPVACGYRLAGELRWALARPRRMEQAGRTERAGRGSTDTASTPGPLAEPPVGQPR